MKISVVIPAYNEEELIEKTLIDYQKFLSENYSEFELILVDDGSSDKTLEVAKACKDVVCISYRQNRGKGYAVKRGFLRATGDYIFFTDADLSYSPQNISRAIQLFKTTNSSGVVGIRKDKKKDYTFFRRVVSDVFAKLVKFIISTSLADTQCGFKGFEKKTGKQIFSRSKIFDFGFDFEVIYLSQILGKSISAMPISFNHRKKTRIQPLRDGLRMVKDLIYLKRSGTNGNIKKRI